MQPEFQMAHASISSLGPTFSAPLTITLYPPRGHSITRSSFPQFPIQHPTPAHVLPPFSLTKLTSLHAAPVCGDGACSATETVDMCPTDCARTVHVPPADVAGVAVGDGEQVCSGNGVPASRGDTCVCFEGYEGTWCEDCMRGYFRVALHHSRSDEAELTAKHTNSYRDADSAEQHLPLSKSVHYNSNCVKEHLP